MSAECAAPPPSCSSAPERLAFDGEKFVCQSSVVAASCTEGDLLTGINSDGSLECRNPASVIKPKPPTFLYSKTFDTLGNHSFTIPEEVYVLGVLDVEPGNIFSLSIGRGGAGGDQGTGAADGSSGENGTASSFDGIKYNDITLARPGSNGANGRVTVWWY